jgi:DNA-binding response OmpR family regulator
MLTTEGFNVYTTDLGEEGLDLGKLYDYDIILLDLNLPDMHGVDVLAKIKSDEKLRRAPVVVLTTTDDQREVQRCYDMGANVYITKPVEYESFSQAIRQLGLFLSVIQVPETL